MRGGFVGGTAGYNWQFGRFVFGLEGDYAWANIDGRSATCGTGMLSPHPCGTELQSFGTVRGRVGYVAGPTGLWLPYLTGGLAVGQIHAWDALTPAGGSAFRTGWAAGGGVEARLGPHWTIKAEYLYMDLGAARLFDVVPGVPETVSFRTNLVRAGLNYHFSATPPATRY